MHSNTHVKENGTRVKRGSNRAKKNLIYKSDNKMQINETKKKNIYSISQYNV